jgi:opacity protein-like surface antigen
MSRRLLWSGAFAAASLLCLDPSAARAQAAPSGSTHDHGYAVGLAQSSFGNVTTQSYGGEVGVLVRPRLAIVVDAGLVRNAAPDSLTARAQTIVAGIAAAAGSADARVRVPVGFGVAGISYGVRSAAAEPYVTAGAGLARVNHDVTFTVPGGDVSQFVTLGRDLAGTETKPMISAGGGVRLRVWQSVLLDLGYRFGRVFASGEGLTIHRAGVGIGVRF